MAIARRSPIMNVMVEAAEKAARGLLRDFGEVENLQVSKKGPADFVSSADHKSEKTIVAVLQKARPTFDMLLEEGGDVKGADRNNRWIVDPLDGTSNFLHGIPHWSITIAHEKDGEIVAGLVYDPIKDELFTAEKGCGGFMNNRRLRPSSRSNFDEALIALGGARTGNTSYEVYTAELDAIVPHVAATRRFGSAALDIAYVACGRSEAFWERGINAWDVGAASLILKEAGGKVTDLDGGKNYVHGRSILATNGPLHEKFLTKLKAARDGVAHKTKSA